jgi:cysteine desulfurase
MHLGDEMARASIRFSLGRFSTSEEIDFVVSQVTKTVTELRQNNPLWDEYRNQPDKYEEDWFHPRKVVISSK